MATFTSSFNIDDEVMVGVPNPTPTAMEYPPYKGIVMAVTFTRDRILYDVYVPTFNRLYTQVITERVTSIL